MIRNLIFSLGILLFIPPAFAQGQVSYDAEATLINNNGETIGNAYLSQGSDGMLVTVHVFMMAPGLHGVHLHETGTCEDIDSFKKSGGHLNVLQKEHGYLNPQGYHEGDLPNMMVEENKIGYMEGVAPNVFLDGGESFIFDKDGTAIIIHEGPDDHYSQPIGGAGNRIACGVFKKPGQD